MKISTGISISSQTNKNLAGPSSAIPKANTSFKSVYESISSKGVTFNLDTTLSQIAKVKESLQSSKVIQAKDVLLYQVQISELNMRIEMLSKAADSAASVIRRLQNSQ